MQNKATQNDGGPAFPDMLRLQMCRQSVLSERVREIVYLQSHGMSLRDYFAAKAMQGFIASLSTQEALAGLNEACAANGLTSPQMHAKMAYAVADAMLLERQQNG